MNPQTILYVVLIVVAVILLIRIASGLIRALIFGLIIVFAYQLYTGHDVTTAINKVKDQISSYSGAAKTGIDTAKKVGDNLELKDGKVSIKTGKEEK